MKKTISLTFTFAFIFAVPALAGEGTNFKPIKDKDLVRAMTGAMMLSEYLDHGDDIIDFTELHNKDGSTDYTPKGKPLEKGTWDIVGGDKICYRYPDSNEHPGPYCYVIYLREGCYYSYSVARMTHNGPRDWDNWSYRAVEKGSGNSCAVPVS